MKELTAILGLRADPMPSGVDSGVIAPEAAAPEITLEAPKQARHVRRAGYAILLLLTACATASAPGRTPLPLAPALGLEERAAGFLLDAPLEEALGPDLRLWATH